MTAKKKKHGLRKQWPFYVMMAPGLLYLLVNNYGPISGLFIAFKQIDYTKGIFGSPWVGFKNFTYLFKTNAAFQITRNTILYNLIFIIVGTVTGVATGIMLSELRHRAGNKIFPDSSSAPLSAFLGYLCLYRLCFSEQRNRSS